MKRTNNNKKYTAEKKIQQLKRLLPCIVILVCSGMMYTCKENVQEEAKLDYFIPKTDQNGTIRTSKQGDTLWHQIPPFAFTDENGNTVTEAIMEDKIVVADFFFTTCPSICIAMSQHLGRVQEHFKGNDEILILSHTVDPETDTPAVLKAYADTYHADPKCWKFLTGEKHALYDQARNGYFVTAIEGDGGPTDFIHSEKLVLVDKHQHIRGFFRGTHEEDVEALIQSIEVLLKEH